MRHGINPIVMSFTELALFAAIMMAASQAKSQKTKATAGSTTKPAIAQTVPSVSEDLAKKIKELEKQAENLDSKSQHQRQLDSDEIRRLKDLISRDTMVRAELLGLKSNAKGKLGNVVFVFDHTSHMFTTGAWEQSRLIFKTWIDSLSVDKCAVIFFGTTVDAFQDGAFVDMKPNTPDRTKLEEYFDNYSNTAPAGYTDTRAALEKALKCRGVDAVVLFTHGAPKLETTGVRKDVDVGEEQKIYALCQQQGVPINVVAVGDYFDKNASDFLKELAKETGGAFMGR